MKQVRIFRCVALILLLCGLLVGSVSATGTANQGASVSFTDVGIPERLPALYNKLQNELYQYAGICTAVFAMAYDGNLDTLRTQAQAYLADDTVTSVGDKGDWVIVCSSTEAGFGTIACGETVAAILTDEDIARIEAAFTEPADGDAYARLCNGMKQLVVCVFDGGAFDYPAYSYAADYLRDPDAAADSALLPSTRLLTSDLLDELEKAQCVYLGNEIGRYADLTLCLSGSATGDADELAAEASLFQSMDESVDAESLVVLAYDTTLAQADVTLGANAGLTEDDAAQVAQAMEAAEGDCYAHLVAGLEELTRLLYLDGAREYAATSAIAQIVNPNADSASGGVPVAVWVALAVVLCAAVALALALRKKKNTP